MRTLLSMIGSTSKRDDFAMARRDFLGQFGIGLLSASSWPTPSRSSPGPPARRTRRPCAGSAAATEPSRSPSPPARFPEPGTEVRLHPRYRAYRWCEHDSVVEFASDFAELLDVAVRIRDTVVSQKLPPWKLTTDEQLAWCRERFGFEAMGIIPLESTSADVTGLAFVLPYTARPGYRTGDRIYSKGMLVADRNDLIVPCWAFAAPSSSGRACSPRRGGPAGVARAAVRPQADRLPPAKRAHPRARHVPRRLPRDHRAARRGAEGAGGARVRRSRPAAVHAALRHDRGRSHHPAAHREPRSRSLRPGRRHLPRALRRRRPRRGAAGRRERRARGGAAAARRRRHPGALPRGHRARRDRAGRPRAPRRPASSGARRQGRPGAARRARVRAGGELRAGGPARAMVACRRALLRRRPGCSCSTPRAPR